MIEPWLKTVSVRMSWTLWHTSLTVYITCGPAELIVLGAETRDWGQKRKRGRAAGALLTLFQCPSSGSSSFHSCSVQSERPAAHLQGIIAFTAFLREGISNSSLSQFIGDKRAASSCRFMILRCWSFLSDDLFYLFKHTNTCCPWL